MNDSDDRNFPPFLEEVLDLAKKRAPSDTEDWSTVIFDEEAIEKLKKLLASYFGSRELPNRVYEFIWLADFFDQKNANEACDALLEVARTATDALAALREQTTNNKDDQSINIPEKRSENTEEK